MKNKLMLLGAIAIVATMQSEAMKKNDLTASLAAAQIRQFDVNAVMQQCNISPQESAVALEAFTKTQKQPLEEFLSQRVKPILSKIKENASENEMLAAVAQQPPLNRQSKIALLNFIGNIGAFYTESLLDENNAEDSCDRQFIALLLHHADFTHSQVGSDLADIINPGTGNPANLAQQMIDAIQ